MSRDLYNRLKLELDCTKNPYIYEESIRTNLFKFIGTDGHYGMDLYKYSNLSEFAINYEDYFGEIDEVLIPFIHQSKIYPDVVFTLYTEERYYKNEPSIYYKYVIINGNYTKYKGELTINYKLDENNNNR